MKNFFIIALLAACSPIPVTPPSGDNFVIQTLHQIDKATEEWVCVAGISHAEDIASCKTPSNSVVLCSVSMTDGLVCGPLVHQKPAPVAPALPPFSGSGK